MTNDQQKPFRRSIRLNGYDYTSPGAYFVTSCSQNRRNIFGEIRDDVMIANPAGQMLELIWHEIPGKFPTVQLDAFVIMPNHVHFIIFLTAEMMEENLLRGKDLSDHPIWEEKPSASIPNLKRVYQPSLSQVLQWYKSITTAKYRQGVKKAGWPPFSGRIWQQNYYEHIVRNERELNAIREYIVHNPLKWLEDPDHPNNHNQ